MSTVVLQNDQVLTNNMLIPELQVQNHQNTIFSQVEKVQHPPKDQASQNVQPKLPLNENQGQKRYDKLSVKKDSKNRHHRFAPR